MIFLFPEAFILLFGILYFYLQIKNIKKDSQMLADQKRYYLLLLSAFLMIVALSQPVLPKKTHEQKAMGSEAVIGVDLSYSMRADDIKPSRLQSAFLLLKSLFDSDVEDRFALYGFTTQPLILSPSTTDHHLLKNALDAIEVDNILTRGTSIKKLLSHLSKSKHHVKNLILITDGGDESYSKDLADVVQKSGIRIIVVGMASKKGALLKDQYGKELKDKNGDLVISRLNPILEILAKKTGGVYIEYTKNEIMADAIIKALHQTNLYESFSIKHKSYTQLFPFPLFIAILLMLAVFLRLPKRLILFLGLSFSQADAGVLDWFYIHKAQDSFVQKDYKEGVKSLKSISHVTLQSRFDEALLLYDGGDYYGSLGILESLQSKDLHLKKQILFLMGNAYVRLFKYNQARRVYKKALLLQDDEDIRYNLSLIKDKHNKKERKPPAFKKSDQTHKTQAKKKKKQSKKSHQNRPDKSGKKKISRPLGYKAYELINKGYINEKKPW